MKNYISNQDKKRYLIFESGAEEQIDKVAAGMLDNNDIKGMIPFSVMQFDDKVAARYDITSLISVSELLEKCISRETIISVIDSVLTVMENAEDYLIDPGSVILDCEKMFYDEKDGRLCMCVMPFVGKNNSSPSLRVFFKNFICRVKFDSTENCDYIGKMLGYLNSENEFSTEDFRYIVDEQKCGIAVVDECEPDKIIPVISPEENDEEKENEPPVKFTLKKPEEEYGDITEEKEEPAFRIPLDFYADEGESENENGNIKGILSRIFKESKGKSKGRKKDSDTQDDDRIMVQYCDSEGEIISEKGTVLLDEENKKTFLLRVSNNEKIIIKGNKFRIGTEKKSVDYCIKDNCAVSRMHAEIIHKNNSYFIVDNNSTNHTFINEQEIRSKREMRLQNRSRIKLADEEFIFYS